MMPHNLQQPQAQQQAHSTCRSLQQRFQREQHLKHLLHATPANHCIGYAFVSLYGIYPPSMRCII
jgi:hypothetical protein